MTTTTDFNAANKASEVLAKIGSGAADADFARAIHEAIDRVLQTEKKAKVRVEVEITPDNQKGALFLRARVSARLPELPPPSSQMHVGAGNALMTQNEWLFSGRDERRQTPIEKANAAAQGEAPQQPSSPSGRFAATPAPAPPKAPAESVPARPNPEPVAGKDRAAGEQD